MAYVTQDQVSGHYCNAVFKRLTTNVYAGYWHDCRFSIGGKYINFVDIVTCDEVSSVPPPTEIYQKPYIFKRVGDRRPVPGFPDTYNNICGSHK